MSSLTTLGRSHFCHQYKSLDFAAGKIIWQKFMGKAQESAQVTKVEVGEDGIEQLAKMALNRRQVKCLFQDIYIENWVV